MPDTITRLSWEDIFPALKSWTGMVRIERHPDVCDGIITAISQDTGALEVSVVVQGKGRRTFAFELAGADFERFRDPGDWDEALIVFPLSGSGFTLRKWKDGR